jgi:hypothetical protein
MSGMDQFLAQHYGTGQTNEDTEKVAQAEMFLKLAAQNGIDVNALDDQQVESLWNATWNSEKIAEEETKEEEKDEKVEQAKKEHEEKKEGAAKLAEADYMGRVMAHAYVNELEQIKEAGKIGDAARSAGSAIKHQATGRGHFGKAKDAKGWGRAAEAAKGTAHAAAIPTAVGGTAFGAHKLLKKKDKSDAEKTSSALDEVAANFAIEKAASYGFDPEEAVQRVGAVLTLGIDESEKIAQVNDFDTAVDVRSSELLEAAGYPIDWSGTPFDKTAGERASAAWEAAKGVAKKFPGAVDISAGLHGRKIGKGGEKGSFQELLRTTGTKNVAKGVAKAGLTVGAGAGAVYGGVKGVKHLRKGDGGKDEGEKNSSAEFDHAAAELAIEKAASVGWDTDQAIDRINSVFTLGYEGDPSESEKVASVQTQEDALNVRAHELLELAGYPINW